ncbi:hypothetical protein FACS189449_10230 [Alphaproteobacteria bacterium]|nr:hypothetical protein FACS189449_10230 [Alphaproteobacteria bacterium]
MDDYSFFSVLDYVYIFIILISCTFGFASGFTKVILSTATWYGSCVISAVMSPFLYGFTEQFFRDKGVARGVASVLAYIIAVIFMLLLSKLISDKIKQSVLSGVDRALGLFVGLIRGISVPICVCAVFVMFDISRNKFETIKNSRISSIFFDVMEDIIPQTEKRKISQKIRDGGDSLKKSAGNAIKASKFKARELTKKDNTEMS